MKMKDIWKLRSGDQVHWTDPDGGICSRTFTVQTIKVKGNIVYITDKSGGYLECFAKELS
jgi:outer membrane protein assembly factor BamB